jgi:hypothetical protein
MVILVYKIRHSDTCPSSTVEARAPFVGALLLASIFFGFLCFVLCLCVCVCVCVLHMHAILRCAMLCEGYASGAAVNR